MRLIIHDTPVTTPYTAPLAAGWVEPSPELAVELRPALLAADVGPEDAALLPAPEIARLQTTHQLVPDAAVVADAHGAVVLRTPVRPDEVERGPVRLLGTSSLGEFLARATLQPFYGIEASAWPRRDDDPTAAEAQAVVVEGAEALRPPDAGFAEDLSRAWFILTGSPVVSHLLAAPLALDRAALAPLLAFLAASRAAADTADHRRAWRAALAARHDLPRDPLPALFARQRLALDPSDRPALLNLLQRGGRGSSYPPLTALQTLAAP